MEKTTAAVVGEFMERALRDTGTEVLEVKAETGADLRVPFVVIDDKRKLIDVADIVRKFEAVQDAPFRRKGVYQAADVASLVRWMNDHTDEAAPVFGQGLESLGGEWRTPKLALIGIGNYSHKDAPGWHDFRVRYDFPVSHAWTIWAANHSEDDKPKWMGQDDFAEFVEARIHDLSSLKSGDQVNEAVTRFLEASGGKASDAATPSQMFKISRDLKIMSQEKIEAKIDLHSGEARLQYSQEHTGPGGHPLKVPSHFYIRIPVFFGQAAVLIGVKLRYRNAGGGSVQWAYSLFSPDLVVVDEFQKACEIVKNAPRTVFLGSPDGVDRK